MKILVALAQPESARDDDFNFTFDREPLSLPTLVCSTAERRENCGCGRCFSGIASKRAITYATVGEVAATEDDDFVSYFRESPHVDGWTTDEFPAERTFEIMWSDMTEIARLIDDQPVGTEIRVEQDPETFVLILPDASRREGSRSPELPELIAAGMRRAQRTGRTDQN